MTTTEHITADYAFHVEYVDDEGRRLQEQRIGPADFDRAIQHTRFDALRRGLVQEYPQSTGQVAIVPMFPSGDSTSPHARGFQVMVTLSPDQAHTCQFKSSYFRSSADRIRAECRRRHQLTPEQRLYYRLHALLDDEPLVPPFNELGISLEPARPNIAVGSACRGNFGPTQAWDTPHPADMPALVDPVVLEEAVYEGRAHAEQEVGGFLLGSLLRDHPHGGLYLVVSGFASAGGTTIASNTTVTFTPGSFAEAKRIIRLRGLDESVVGWTHSHPFRLCEECPLPTPPECIAKVLFYSLDDIHLMETTFSQPYMIGLVTGIDSRIESSLGHLPVKLYGWRNGEITERGFEVMTGTVS